MKLKGMFGSTALLVAGAAIGGGAMVTQNAMAGEDASLAADSVTMVRVDAQGSAVQCTFTGPDVEDLIRAVPSEAPIQGHVVVESAGAVEADATLTTTDSGSGLLGDGLLGDAVPTVALPSGGVVSVGGTAEGEGELVVSGETPNVEPILASTARDGTVEECAALKDQTLSDVAGIGAQGSGSVVINVTGGVGVTIEP